MSRSQRSEESGNQAVVRWWIIGSLVGVGIIVFMLPSLLERERPHYEASGVGSLRTIYTAQVSYAQAHPEKGFAPSLAVLGPDGSDLIDSVLASGTKSAYAFVLVPEPPDSQGRIRHYVVTARPQRYQRNGTHNFFADESGVIRFTVEDRPATANDPVLQ